MAQAYASRGLAVSPGISTLIAVIDRKRVIKSGSSTSIAWEKGLNLNIAFLVKYAFHQLIRYLIYFDSENKKAGHGNSVKFRQPGCLRETRRLSAPFSQMV